MNCVVSNGAIVQPEIGNGAKIIHFLAHQLSYSFISKSLHIYAASDAGLMMQNLMLSAHAHGLGTCAQGAVNIWDDVIRKEFNIPKSYRLLCGLAIGYQSNDPVNSFSAHRLDVHEIIVMPKNKTDVE